MMVWEPNQASPPYILYAQGRQKHTNTLTENVLIKCSYIYDIESSFKEIAKCRGKVAWMASNKAIGMSFVVIREV